MKIQVKFGMRIVKTILAVLLSIVITEIYGGNSFFAVIAAILCMQKDPREGYDRGLIRVKGTLIGGAFGLISLLLFQALHIQYQSIPYLLIVAFMAAPIINLNLWLSSPKTARFSCVVYYSVVIGKFQGLEPFLYVGGRMLDTMTGIGVALLINYIFPSTMHPIDLLDEEVQ